MTVEIVVVGAGGYGREVRAWLRRAVAAGASWDVLGFVDDNPSLQGAMIGGDPVLGGLDWLRNKPGLNVVLGIAVPHVKRRVVERLRPMRLGWPPVLDPSVIQGDRVSLGEGVTAAPRTLITSDLVVGAFATLNAAAIVGHDCRVGDFCTVGPAVNLSGYTTLGDGVDLGTGAITIPGRSIGAWSVVGAGAVVTTDVPPNAVAVGVPARVVKTRAEGWHIEPDGGGRSAPASG